MCKTRKFEIKYNAENEYTDYQLLSRKLNKETWLQTTMYKYNKGDVVHAFRYAIHFFHISDL